MKLGITDNIVGFKTTTLAVKPDEVVFLACSVEPWQVSEREFASIVALLRDDSLPTHERENVLAFFALACDMAAQHDPTAADVVSVYRAACAKARELGEPVFEGA